MKRTKFEKMMEHLINEDRKGAEALFHEIIVEKSRKIYESLLEGDDEFDMEGDPTDDFESDVEMDDEPMDDEFGDEEDMGADDELGDEEFGDEEEMGEEELEDRVVDLEDALDDLKAEFERMMADEDDMGEESEDDMDFDSEDVQGDESEESGEDEMDFDMEDSKGDEEPDELKDDIQTMREYVEKVASPKPGDNGQNTRSVVANSKFTAPKADSKNIAQSTEAKGKGGTGAGKPKEDDMGNVNKPGAKAGKLNKAGSAKMGPSDSEPSMIGSRKRSK